MSTGSANGSAGSGPGPTSGAANSPMMTGPGAGGSTSTTGTAGSGAATSDVGRVAIHRLNNLEYDNTVMDLTGVPGMARATFQPDEEGGGFDNNADAFTVNDARYEQYFNSADTIGEAVWADATLKGNIIANGAGCAPSADTACTQKIISAFGLKAWRRPLVASEVTRLTQLATDAVTAGETPTDAIKQVVKALLASPQFLYRIEYDPTPTSLAPHALSAYELASRLSYLGWSTMPDATMFGLAASNSLLTDVNIQAQIDRMLADPARGETFTQTFAGQWLGARDMQSHQVEPTAYPMFDEPLRAAMVQEEFLYFDEFLKGSLPMTQFFTTNENFVNARLAQHYGFAAPAGTGYVKVTTGGPSRVGFMGLASFLTFTSFSYRTAPTLRGKWVLQNLLCQVIPNPPANVPKLDTTGSATDPALQSENIRTRLAAHRVATNCSACHNTLDPIGLGVENFDAVGAYRTKYANGDTIDSSGVLPTGETFTSLSQLATILAGNTPPADGSPSYQQKLTDCASQTMMTYALSRGLVSTDQGYLNQVRSQWATQGWGLKPLLKDIVLNDTFRFRHGEAAQ
jgi:hypothetical protein